MAECSHSSATQVDTSELAQQSGLQDRLLKLAPLMAGFEGDAMGESKRRSALRAIEVTFRGMAPRDALVYFVRRCASVRRLHGEALRASLQHLPAQGYQVALELRSGGRTFRSTAMHTAAIVAVCRAFEALSPRWF